MLTHKHSQRSTASAQTNSPTRRRRLTWRDCSRGQVTGWAVCTANTPTNTPRCSCNKQTNMQQQIHCSSASGESAALSSASTDFSRSSRITADFYTSVKVWPTEHGRVSKSSPPRSAEAGTTHLLKCKRSWDTKTNMWPWCLERLTSERWCSTGQKKY